MAANLGKQCSLGQKNALLGRKAAELGERCGEGLVFRALPPEAGVRTAEGLEWDWILHGKERSRFKEGVVKLEWLHTLYQKLFSP